MDKRIWKVVLGIFVFLTMAGIICAAGQRGGGGRGGFGGRGDPNRQFEPPKEFIDWLMAEIKKKDPNKAKELEVIRQKEPTKFIERLKTVATEEFKTIWDEGMESYGRGRGGPGGGRGGDGRGGGDDRRRSSQRDEGILKLVQENFPEDFNSFKSVDPNTDSRLSERMMDNLRRRFGPLYDRIQDNPKLKDVLIQEFRLTREQWTIVFKIQEAKTENEKTKLRPDLEKVVSQLYDVKVKIKEIEFERLIARLEELKKMIEENKSDLGKWNNPETKKEQIKLQIERLTETRRRGPFGF